MDELVNYLKSLNPKDNEKHILIFGKKYKVWKNGKYLGEATWRKDENVGDSFQRDKYDTLRKIIITEVIIADQWQLII